MVLLRRHLKIDIRSGTMESICDNRQQIHHNMSVDFDRIEEIIIHENR